ncbi:nucleotidyltransferase [Verrucomicrobiota bacterium]
MDILIDELDISETKYQEAEARYEAVGKWLERPDSSVRQYSPEVYVQGSFRLGTVIKPVSEDGEYDIDSVCKLDLKTSQCSQQQLKLLIGKEIKAYVKAQDMNKPAEEGKRCWTLNYADKSKFHMDILPAIPNASGFRVLLESKSASSDWTDDAIGITDNTLPDYDKISIDWPVSNPKGYADWFRMQMSISTSTIYKRTPDLMEKYAAVEDVPTFRFKTPLQRIIQILKYHRDIRYGDDEDKPISIIISTLAAHAYNNEDDLIIALQNVLPRMLNYIEERDGIRWITNPVNPLENFADKWPDHPEREKKFYEWHAAATESMELFLGASAGLQNLNEGLSKIAGDDIAKRVMSRYGTATLEARKSGKLKAAKGTATLGVIGTAVKGHNFHG